MARIKQHGGLVDVLADGSVIIEPRSGKSVVIDGIEFPNIYGQSYYVDTNRSTSGNGRTRATAFTTMEEAFAAVESGDRIYFVGNVLEHLVTPIGAQDVTIIGGGNRPHYADTHPGNAELSGNSWRSAGTNSPLVTLRNKAWRFLNINFVPHASNYAIEFQRNAIETALGEFDASDSEVIGCRFPAGGGAVHDTGGCANVLVEGNSFEALTTCILGVGNIGVGQSNWNILGNKFLGFDNGVKIAGFGCMIKGNSFTEGLTPDTTFVLNTNNSGGSNNTVVENAFNMADNKWSTPDIVGTATDIWNQNYTRTAVRIGSA
jgi:hypothetical protein